VTRRVLVQSGDKYRSYDDPLTWVIGLLTENEETKAVAALKRLDIARRNEAMAVFTRFIKFVEGNFTSCFNIFSMLQKPLTVLDFCVPANM
jgi:hypothetical protein